MVHIDPSAAQAAATAFLNQMDKQGAVTATTDEVRVTVTVTRPGLLLPILGIDTPTVRVALALIS